MFWNRTKTLILLSALTALFLWIGHALGGQGGLLLALVIAGAMNFGAYWFSDRIVLRMHGAQEVTAAEAPELHWAVRDLALRAGLPMPRVYIMPDDAPNAFATGRDPQHAAVAVTQGLLNLLSRDEVEGVLAHELAHIRNRDTLVMAVAATLAGALSTLANMAAWGAMLGAGRSDEGEEGPSPLAGLLGVLVAPFAAMLIQMAISRSREFMADEYAARVTGNPMALASAIRRIVAGSRRVPISAGSPATAHLYIINPFRNGGLAQLFSTHPSTAARVDRLEAMLRGGFELAA
jgi:heat shock protein HtpX